MCVLISIDSELKTKSWRLHLSWCSGNEIFNVFIDELFVRTNNYVKRFDEQDC